MAGKKEFSAVVVKDFKRLQIFPVPDGESEQSCGGPEAGGFWMAAIYTHTPGGKPAPGFTFGIARPLIGPATMSQDQMAGGTAHPDGQRWIRRSRTTNCRP